MTHTLWDMRLRALHGIPRIEAGDDLAQLIWQAAVHGGDELADGDVIVIAQKVVSKAEGRVTALDVVAPGSDAQRLAAQTGRDPRLCQVILDEADHIVEVKGRHIVTVDRHGMRNTSAGVDRSNTEPGTVVLLPSDPDTSARRVCDRIRDLSGATVAVIIADTFGSPFRLGGIGAAIGIAGIRHLEQPAGEADLYGNPAAPVTNRVDELAAAASVLMGQTGQGLPAVLIRGAQYTRDDNAAIAGLIIDQTAYRDYTHRLPAKRMAAAILVHDGEGRHLLVQTTYKSGWELLGGTVEKGESPLRAGIREGLEELGLALTPGRLLAVDWVPERDGRTDGLMLVFDGGTLTPQQIAAIRLPADELAGWQWCTPAQEAERLIPLLARRAAACREARLSGHTVYLEDGHRVIAAPPTIRTQEPAP